MAKLSIKKMKEEAKADIDELNAAKKLASAAAKAKKNVEAAASEVSKNKKSFSDAEE